MVKGSFDRPEPCVAWSDVWNYAIVRLCDSLFCMCIFEWTNTLWVFIALILGMNKIAAPILSTFFKTFLMIQNYQKLIPKIFDQILARFEQILCVNQLDLPLRNPKYLIWNNHTNIKWQQKQSVWPNPYMNMWTFLKGKTHNAAHWNVCC